MSGEDAFAAIAAELYGLTPGQFTDARNDYAKQLRSEDRELSEQVKSLKKPSMAAWVVNLLVRQDADEMVQVLALGEALRQAQSDLDGDAMRELAKQRRRLIAAVAGKGRSMAKDLGEKVSESVMRQVEDTLHAAMIDTDAAEAVRSGLLVDPLSPAGIGSLKVASAVAEHTALGSAARPLSEVLGSAGAGLPVSRSGDGSGRGTNRGSGKGTKKAASGKKAGLHAVPGPTPEELAERKREEQRKAREAAQLVVDEAQADVEHARSVLEERQKAVADLEAECLQVNAEVDELKRRIAELEDRLDRLDDDADEAREGRELATQQVAIADSALAQAQAELEKLGE